MAQALVLVEQGQLCSGMRPFTAHYDAGAGRVAVQTDYAGQLGDLSAITQRPVLVQGGMPEAVGHGPDGAADRLGNSRRIQQQLGWLSPIEFEEKYYTDQATAERANLTPLQPALTS